MKEKHKLSSSTRGRIVQKMKEGYKSLGDIQSFFPRTKITYKDLEFIKKTSRYLKTYEKDWKTYRICTGCNNHKEWTWEFFPYREKEQKKLHPICRRCKGLRATARRRKNIKEAREKGRVYYHKTKKQLESRQRAIEKSKTKAKKIDEMTPEEARKARARRRKYGQLKREKEVQEKIKQKRLSLNQE